MKRLICALLCLMISIIPAFAAELSVDGPSGVLMHSGGKLLFEKNAHERLPIASVTKIMTVLLVFEAIDGGSLSLSDKVTASAHSCSMGGTQIWLEEGEQLTVEEMLKAVLICSANDCAVALGEHIAGSEEAFVERMNRRAKELGMNDTTFINACGLDEKGHLSSACDVALMSAELIKHDKVKEYTVIWQDTLRDGKFVMTNTNKMLKTYNGLTGLKTGFTSTAGYCLSATAQRGDMELIAVMLDCETSPSRNADVAKLLDYGFANYTALTPTPDRPLMPVEVKLGKSDFVRAELSESEPVLAKKGDIAKIEKSVSMEKYVQAPVEKGQKLGEMIVSQNGEVLAAVPIIAAEPVERLGFFGILAKMLKFSFMR